MCAETQIELSLSPISGKDLVLQILGLGLLFGLRSGWGELLWCQRHGDSENLLIRGTIHFHCLFYGKMDFHIVKMI